MKTINVIKAFTLTTSANAQQRFELGIQEVEDDVAEHWYTKAHSEGLPEPADEKPAEQVSRRKRAESKANDGEPSGNDPADEKPAEQQAQA